MCALIAMAVFDTEENNRTWMTEKTLESLQRTVNLKNHELFVVDNASCNATKNMLSDLKKEIGFTLITNIENVGTAKAINQAWKQRKPGQHLIKMDNDVVIHQSGWVDLMEEALTRVPDIGIIGLKRKDLAETPFWPDGHPWKSQLFMFPHIAGQKWIIGEEVQHVFGTCQMYNSALINKIGGLYQMDGIYGFDDALAAVRCKIAQFTSVFLTHIEIDHIDPGDTPYQKEKEKYAGEMMAKFDRVKEEYYSGNRDIYYPL